LTSAAFESLLRRERAIICGALAGITLLAWVYLVQMARAMAPMEMDMGMAMPHMHPWGAGELAMLIVMWVVMMAAMMLPSAAPMILMFATVHRRRGEQRRPVVPTGVFVLGYVVVWSAFSVAAALLQWALHAAALLSPAMTSTSPLVGGALLVAAGLFQWTPLKSICLAHCRSPLSFLMTEWREGARGAFIMGVRHGGYCVGCCWVLMGLLFVAGVMNLLWVAAIAIFVLIEKVVPRGEQASRVAGVVLIVAGLAVALRRLF
jgi:predicted metal-binding membrane protein